MIKNDLSDIYRAYIACLNKQDWTRLKQFVDDNVSYNGQEFGLRKYRQMLEKDFYKIPDRELCRSANPVILWASLRG